MTDKKSLADLSPDDFDSEEEFEREFVARGGQIVDGGSTEDAPNEILLDAFHATDSPGMKAYLAALLVDRGICCTASDCPSCDDVRAHAVAWKQFLTKWTP